MDKLKFYVQNEKNKLEKKWKLLKYLDELKTELNEPNSQKSPKITISKLKELLK